MEERRALVTLVQQIEPEQSQSSDSELSAEHLAVQVVPLGQGGDPNSLTQLAGRQTKIWR